MAIDGDVGLWQENAGSVYNAREYRRLLDRMLMGWDVRTSGGSATSGTANGGVSRSGDLAVSQRGAGANMSVDVALGGGIVGITESAHGGDVFAYSDATINVAITASDPTNPRIDIVGIRVRDSEYSGASDDTQVVVVTGTAAGVPAEPTLPANFLTLARVDVAAAAASILTANITDRRRRLAALGGVIPCTSTTRPTVGLWEGMHIYETDTDKVYVYSGAAWVQTAALAAWDTFTPQLYQAGNRTSSVAVGRYTVSGKKAVLHVRCVGSAAGSAGSAVQIQGIPAAIAALKTGTPNSTADCSAVGPSVVVDSGTAAYGGGGYFSAAQILSFIDFSTSAGADVGVNPSFALAVGDAAVCDIVYEIA